MKKTRNSSFPLGAPALIMHNGILLNGCKILHYDSRQKIVSILLADGRIVKEHYGSVAYAELVKAVSFLKFRHLSREEKMLCFGTYHFNRRYRRWRSRARKIVQGRRRIRITDEDMARCSGLTLRFKEGRVVCDSHLSNKCETI